MIIVTILNRWVHKHKDNIPKNALSYTEKIIINHRQYNFRDIKNNQESIENNLTSDLGN